ncbi:ribonuclease H-like domain-containing protein [Tanacetum coccineum]|uniref:Ribonuclease H-like domain-containing protein n=1 Tax=Tanacetum coccineum TaxID=301880 RepID=A0ABQ5JGE8_9ASTR
MELESTNSGPTAKLPLLKLVIENGDSWVLVPHTSHENGITVYKMSTPVTAEEKTNKKNDVKARESLDSIFNRLQKIVSRLAILGVIINQEDLNLKFLSSLPPEWNTQNKTVGTSSGSQNMAFMTAPSSSSTNDANTACPQVSAASPSDLEQIHEDDLEAIDLKWQLSLLSVRAKKTIRGQTRRFSLMLRYFARYDKSKVECYNYHKLGHFARECKAPRSKEGQFRNQDNIRKQGNNEDTSSKAMLAIDGVGIDWSDMAEEQVQKNMALMAFSDSEGKPQHDDKGFVDSGCSRHMTATKDETSEILKNFIKEIENLVDKKVKIIRSDNGTEFKNKVMDDFWQKEKGKFDAKGMKVHVVSNDSGKDVDNGEPKTANDAQKQVEDGLNNENAEQERFADDSSTKDVNAAGTLVKEDDSTEEEPEIEPTSIAKALSDSSWVEAMQEELMQFKLQQVWILDTASSASTPVDLEKPLVKDGDADDVDVHLYRSMIGSLMYLTASRPDIMFACKKQTVVATSTTEAEYVAAG